jgi:geranylgeranyl transferase type-2 subunit beta
MSQIIDVLLLHETQQLSTRLRDRVADYVVSKRLSDGGYPGRLGGSDPYYTDFALRILSLTRPEEIRNPDTLAYAEWKDPIANIPECFNRLSIAQLCNVPLPSSAADCLGRHRLASGCFCRSADSSNPSAYCTFLGTICEDIMELDCRISKDSIEAVLKLQLVDGGFVDTESDGNSQTNPTSAAVGYLFRASLLESQMTNGNELDFEIAIDKAAVFLMGMQAKDGGFLAHSKAPYPDLLSTFTALATLTVIDRIKRVNFKGHAQFTGLVADANGGFHSCIVDAESDIEYTYYGLGCLALIAFTAKTCFD